MKQVKKNAQIVARTDNYDINEIKKKFNTSLNVVST